MNIGKSTRRLANPLRPLLALIVLLAGLTHAVAQAPASTGVVGAITAINGATLTITTDKGDSVQVELASNAILKRVPPGQKDLSTAESIQASDLAVGDRAAAETEVKAMCERLLANTVIEGYRVEVG